MAKWQKIQNGRKLQDCRHTQYACDLKSQRARLHPDSHPTPDPDPYPESRIRERGLERVFIYPRYDTYLPLGKRDFFF